MANIKKPIHRTEEFKVMVSKEEKDLIKEYAKSIGILPSRAIRTYCLVKACKKLKFSDSSLVDKYLKYLDITNQKQNTEL